MSTNYINNSDLLEELIKFKESKIISEELGRMLLLLARKYSERGNFAGYSWKEDMIGDSLLTCVKYMDNFDTEKSNPFAYFSRVIQNAFLNYISKQKKHSQIKDTCYKNIDFIMPDVNIEDEYQYFELRGIDYQVIKGNKKKKRRKKKK